MKLNSSVLGLALLCSSLLLSLSPACSNKPQPPKSPTPPNSRATAAPTATPQTPTPNSTPTSPTVTPKAVTAAPTATPQTSTPAATSPSPTVILTASSTAAPSPPTLAGTYTLNDSSATETINRAIEFSVDGMPLGEKEARAALQEANLPPPRSIIISYTSTEVTITTDVAGSLKTAASGRPIEWTWKGQKYEVSTKWENGRLVRIFSGDGRKRVNTYNLSDDGKSLTMRVHATGKRLFISLKHPLEYILRYKRTSK